MCFRNAFVSWFEVVMMRLFCAMVDDDLSSTLYDASFGVCKQSMERYRKLATNNVIEWQRIGAGHNLAGPTTPNGKKRGVKK